MATGEKAPGAFRTIGELSQELGVAQHILRYWETKFPQLRPLQRAGNRRYYRAADVDLARRIHRLLNHEGYTVRGVQKLLRGGNGGDAEQTGRDLNSSSPDTGIAPPNGVNVERLVQLRNRLAAALES